METIFSQIEITTPDPILAVRDQFLSDPNPNKVDLSVGIYQDNGGRTLEMAAVGEAFHQMQTNKPQVPYLSISGLAPFNNAITKLVFGEDTKIIESGRLAIVQSLGGSSALRYGADFLKRHFPSSIAYLSDPSWENHRAIFEHAGFNISTYPYLHADSSGIDFDQMLDALSKAPKHSIIILHACCHNPTGLDLNHQQWSHLCGLFKTHRLIPFIDLAYQGLGDGLKEDALAPRMLADAGVSFLLAYSCSKNFSLYSRRVGALAIVCSNKHEAGAVLSQIKRTVRANNSTAPIDGAMAVSLVLNDNILKEAWNNELSQMRSRIQSMRSQLIEQLHDNGFGQHFASLANQKGMFSYSGLTSKQVLALREKYSIYALESGRICIAALNSKNLSYVTSAICDVVGNDVT